MFENKDQEQIDFAVIGHQDSWPNIESFINGMRSSTVGSLSLEKIKNTFGFIPPRGIFRMKVRSKTGAIIHGIYIETFIEPDKLGIPFLRTNITKVNKAITVAQNLNAKIIALGGFTSIVLEGKLRAFNTSNTKITTGNTLTSAFILKGIEEASKKLNIKLRESNVLIIGATGDIGMACTNYLKGSVRQLLLCARNKRRLENFSNEIYKAGYSVQFNSDLNQLIAQADIIISAASSTNIEIKNCKNPVIICDAGYPKNLELKIGINSGINLFHGGMGQIRYGYDFNPDYRKYFYRYPSPHIGHGCVLEAIVLAFENKFENYTSGKGNINNQKIDEIYAMSLKHGLELAPFYNSNGLWE
jgi:predicted amino acid dehydrogenase